MLILVIIVGFSSCSEEPSLQKNNELDLLQFKNSFFEETDSVKVNKSEVANVVNEIFNNLQTRSLNLSIETVSDSIGKPLYHVVNVGDRQGFIIISATKNFFPVLAYSYRGNFKIGDSMPNGILKWKRLTTRMLEESPDFSYEEKNKFRYFWKRYELKEKEKTEQDIRGALEYQEMKEIMKTQRQKLEAKGYEIYSADSDVFSGYKQLDEEISQYVRECIHPEYQEYWNILTFVARPTRPEIIEVPNFIETEWAQMPGYNISFPYVNLSPAYVGCGPLAVGQAMRYYEYPKSFNWQDMPLKAPTRTTSDFLYEVAKKCRAKFGEHGTETEQIDCASALRSYGYQVSYGVHVGAHAWNDILNKKPVLMRAKPESIDDYNHAWIASGGRKEEFDDSFEVWTFMNRTEFKKVYSFPYGDMYTNYYFYMNWGWNGQYNGFYNDYDIVVKKPEGEIKYSLERTDIYNVTPY